MREQSEQKIGQQIARREADDNVADCGRVVREITDNDSNEQSKRSNNREWTSSVLEIDQNVKEEQYTESADQKSENAQNGLPFRTAEEQQNKSQKDENKTENNAVICDVFTDAVNVSTGVDCLYDQSCTFKFENWSFFSCLANQFSFEVTLLWLNVKALYFCVCFRMVNWEQDEIIQTVISWQQIDALFIFKRGVCATGGEVFSTVRFSVQIIAKIVNNFGLDSFAVNCQIDLFRRRLGSI